MSTTKICLIGGSCKHGNWCSDVYCQEHCRFVKEIDQLDALAELCEEAKGGWDLPPAAVSRLGALARKARAAIAMQQAQAEAVPWGDMKIAFDVENDEALWDAYDAQALHLPNGWSLVETDCSGARCVALFRVKTLPTAADGEAVQAAIAKVMLAAAPQPKGGE